MSSLSLKTSIHNVWTVPTSHQSLKSNLCFVQSFVCCVHMCAHDCTVLTVPVVMSLECFVYACTVLYVLQCLFKCCVYTSTCIEEAVVMSLECEFLWYSNNDIILLPARPHVSWGNTLTRNKTTTWSGLMKSISKKGIKKAYLLFLGAPNWRLFRSST